MLTRLIVRNFKRFGDVSIELGRPVVFVGPNNSGKTTALQALALWEIGVRRWNEKRRGREAPEKRPGVTINRQDLVSVPVPDANLLWRQLHFRDVSREGGKLRTRNVWIDVVVEGVSAGTSWTCGLEFDYGNAESIYCRPLREDDGDGGTRMSVPLEASDVHVAYLPPMSGLAAAETRIDRGAIDVRLGEGKTAEVLRNLCHMVATDPERPDRWSRIVERIERLFGVRLDAPEYVPARGEIVMTYRERGVRLDLSSAGRGLQQTLLLLAHMAANPGAVLLLDEPDAHLEVLRQRETYRLLTEVADETGGQIIAASHSEVVLSEAGGRDMVIAFIGSPHRIDDRGSQLREALTEIGFEQFMQAEQTGWVLYLEGSTDLSILQALAERMDHPARSALARPFVRYVGNQPADTLAHFTGLREAFPELVGFGLFDRLDRGLPEAPAELALRAWRQREIENYISQPATLRRWATLEGEALMGGPLFASAWPAAMKEAIEEVESALATLGELEPRADLKASERYLAPIFKAFFARLGMANLMAKRDFYGLAKHVAPDDIDPEVRAVLDAIADTAARARAADAE